MRHVRNTTSALLSTAAVAALGLGATAGPAAAQSSDPQSSAPQSSAAQVVDAGSVTGSLAGAVASSGLPAGSLAGNRCVGLEPGSGLPLQGTVTVGTDSPGVARFDIRVSTPLGPTDVDYTLRWTADGGRSGEAHSTTQSTTGGSYARVTQTTGPGAVHWELSGLTAHNTEGVGSLPTQFTSCSGEGTVD